MAKSPSHILGELIGNFFEEVMKDPIKNLCNKYNVYFDTIGPRPARSTHKITWEDINGSKHDLDYVIERDGTDDIIGNPIAFIEIAWRRYSKHSKNKVQEISGAIMPIAEKYQNFSPFKGVILSGVFTRPSIKQLTSQGFNVLYIPFDKIVESFKNHGVDIFFDENTPEPDLDKIVSKFKTCGILDRIKQDLITSNRKEIDCFLKSLEDSIKRQINCILVLPLHGKERHFNSLDSAINYIEDYSTMPADAVLDRYVIQIFFNDGSNVNCTFNDKLMTIDFLKRNS